MSRGDDMGGADQCPAAPELPLPVSVQVDGHHPGIFALVREIPTHDAGLRNLVAATF